MFDLHTEPGDDEFPWLIIVIVVVVVVVIVIVVVVVVVVLCVKKRRQSNRGMADEFCFVVDWPLYR